MHFCPHWPKRTCKCIGSAYPVSLEHFKVGTCTSLILMLVLCVCVSVCLSPARSQERNVVSLHFFRRRKEILLASCTNCISSLYDTWFERKSLWNFLAGYALEAVHELCTHVTLPVALVRMNLGHHLNAVGTSSKVTR